MTLIKTSRAGPGSPGVSNIKNLSLRYGKTHTAQTILIKKAELDQVRSACQTLKKLSLRNNEAALQKS